MRKGWVRAISAELWLQEERSLMPGIRGDDTFQHLVSYSTKGVLPSASAYHGFKHVTWLLRFPPSLIPIAALTSVFVVPDHHGNQEFCWQSSWFELSRRPYVVFVILFPFVVGAIDPWNHCHTAILFICCLIWFSYFLVVKIKQNKYHLPHPLPAHFCPLLCCPSIFWSITPHFFVFVTVQPHLILARITFLFLYTLPVSRVNPERVQQSVRCE